MTAISPRSSARRSRSPSFREVAIRRMSRGRPEASADSVRCREPVRRHRKELRHDPPSRHRRRAARSHPSHGFARKRDQAPRRADAPGRGPRVRARRVPGACAHHVLPALALRLPGRDRRLVRARDAQRRDPAALRGGEAPRDRGSISAMRSSARRMARHVASTPPSSSARTATSSASTGRSTCPAPRSRCPTRRSSTWRSATSR